MGIPVVPFGSPPVSSEPPADHSVAIRTALAKLGLDATGEPAVVGDSNINYNYRLETNGGTVFVRVHATSRGAERVLLEQRALTWAGDRGVPVVRPLAASNGDSAWEADGTQVSAYPWVDGRHYRRGSIDASAASVLGEMQGRVHAALADLDDPALERSGQVQWDTERSIAELSRVDDLIRYYPAPGEERLRIQGYLREQLALLESGDARPWTGWAHLPLHPVHGDYHERNVIIGESRDVRAVVDWEMVALMPRVYEVLRAVAFMGLLEPDLLRPYLAGYARHARLTEEECREGPEMWHQHDIHSTWSYRQVFIKGDERAARFFAEDNYRLGFGEPVFRSYVASELRAAMA